MKIHPVILFRMGKFKIFSMEQHLVAITTVSVEAVADYGTAKAEGVGGMYTQLVGSASEWVETDSGFPRFGGEPGPFSDTRFTMFRVVYLERSIVGIKTEGESDLPGIALDLPIKEGLVTFDNSAVHELAIQVTVTLTGDSDHQQAGGVHVEAMNGRLLNHLRKNLT